MAVQSACCGSPLEKYTVCDGAFRTVHPTAVHRHGYIEVFLSTAGESVFHIQGKTYLTTPGSLLLVNCDEVHAVSSRSFGEGYVVKSRPEFLLSFCTEQTNLIPNLFLDSTTGNRNLFISNDSLHKILLLIQKCRNPVSDYGSDVLSCVYFIELMVAIFACFQEHTQPASAQFLQYTELITSAMRYIDKHLVENFSLQDVADHVGVSKSYLCRIFKSRIGSTVNQYVTTQRIKRAKELLRTGRNVTETSSESGFNNYSYFIQIFKAATGVTPAKYAGEYIGTQASSKLI